MKHGLIRTRASAVRAEAARGILRRGEGHREVASIPIFASTVAHSAGEPGEVRVPVRRHDKAMMMMPASTSSTAIAVTVRPPIRSRCIATAAG
jgi:hypothetical protein